MSLVPTESQTFASLSLNPIPFVRGLSRLVPEQRLGVAPLRQLFLETARPMATHLTVGAFYRGWRLMGLDGTVFDVPDTPANAQTFGRPTTGRAEGAFPQVRLLALCELGS